MQVSTSVRSGFTVPEIKSRALQEVTGPLDYIEGANDQATLLCLDEFHPVSGAPAGFAPHGNYVMSVLRNAGLKESQIQKVHHKAASDARNDLFEPGPESRKERLHAFIELTALEDLESTLHVIRQATTRPGNQIKTITNSIGSTPIRVANGIFYSSVEFAEDGTPTGITEVGEFIFEALGVPAEPTADNIKTLRNRVLRDSVEVLEKSESFLASRESFERELEQLYERGISYFLSAGNDQRRVDELRQQGFIVSPTAAYISKSVPSAELVAALDTKGTFETCDDEIAAFSSAHPCVSYAAKGIDVEVEGPDGPQLLKGSSLSAPWVAAKRELYRQSHTDLTGSLLEEAFRGTSPRILEGGIAIVE